MSTYRFVSKLRKGMSLHVFLALLSGLLIALQFVLPSIAFASSSASGFTFGTSQDLDRASVSVVRLVATYSPPPLNPGCASSSTGLGVLVGSWASTPTAGSTATDFTNWLLTDGAFVNPQGFPCGTGKGTSQLTSLQVSANTAYTSATTGLILRSLTCQLIPARTSASCTDGKASEALHCQSSPCDSGVVLIPFHTSVPQPYIQLAATDQLSSPSHGIELTGTSSFPPSVGQAMGALTPSRVSIGDPNQKVEQGVPIVNSTGQLLDMQLNANDPAGTIRAYVNETMAPLQTNAVQRNWDTGVTDYYAQKYTEAHTAFLQASTPNPQFKAPAGFLALPAFRGMSSIPSGNGPQTPTRTPTKTPSSNGQPVDVFGLKIPPWLFLPLAIVGVVLIVVLLVLISWLIIRRQAEMKRFEKEQRKAEQKAARDAAVIAEQEKKQRQQVQQPVAPMRKQTTTLGTPANPDLRCPNCNQPVKPTNTRCPSCGVPLTFSASGMNVRLAKPPAGAPPQSPARVPQQSPVLPPQPPVGVPSQSPQPGLVPASAIPDQPTVQMSPSLSRSPYDQDITLPINPAQSSNGPPAPLVSPEQVSGSNAKLGFVVGTRSNPGIKRQHKPNEDSLFAAQGERSNQAYAQQFGLFVVADGMGGHANGQDASRLAIQTIVERLMPRLSSNEQFSDEAYINLLVEGVQEANMAVHKRNMEHRADMGTTMTAALIVGTPTRGTMAMVANVGDSRTYLYREPEGLKKITNDHSVVASLVEAGIIKPDDIYTHPKRNQIYRSLGEKPMIDVDSFKVPLKPGDKLLLCSDGLWDMVRDPLIQQVLSSVPDPSQTGNALIQAALEGGGEDNVSVIVVHITEASQLTGRPNIQLLARPDAPQYPPM